MNNPPVGLEVVCPKCGGKAIAIAPRESKIADQKENADGKVITNCKFCGNQFTTYYLMD